ncbi:hypothetical protein HML84_15445 [Alcanivorax sp. IO_7]|nr:hypothetical protein HML84_15445 [Alcanivorax sp. IO_7]
MSNSFSRSSGAAVVCHDCALRLARPDADRGHWFCPRCGAAWARSTVCAPRRCWPWRPPPWCCGRRR